MTVPAEATNVMILSKQSWQKPLWSNGNDYVSEINGPEIAAARRMNIFNQCFYIKTFIYI